MAHKADSNAGTSCGHTFMDIAVPNANAVDPGPFDGKDPSWHRKRAQYVEQITPQQKFS